MELNDGMKHGLFGKALDKDFNDIENIKEMERYVKDKTKNGTIMYRAVISLKEEDALRLGYDKRETWEQLIKENIFEVGEKIGIPPSRLEHVSAVHMDKGHPHLHLMFWDKEQAVKKAFIHSSTSNQIRINLTKKIFREELQELYQIKNEARDVLLSDCDNFFKEFFEPLKKMTEYEYKETTEKLKTSPDNFLGALINNRISPIFLDDFANKIFEFKAKLPKTGRINYKFLPEELKEELNNIIKGLISSNDDIKREVDRYKETSKTLSSYYTKDSSVLEKSEENAEKEIMKRLSNKLLNSIKKIDSDRYEKNKIKAFRNSEVINIIKELFSFLSRSNEHENAKLNNKRNELSKQAKKELMIKEKNASSIDWER